MIYLAMLVPTSTQLKYISVGSFARTTGTPGNLGGALVVRSELTSEVLQPLCWRGEESLALAAAAVLLGGQMPKAA